MKTLEELIDEYEATYAAYEEVRGLEISGPEARADLTDIQSDLIIALLRQIIDKDLLA